MTHVPRLNAPSWCRLGTRQCFSRVLNCFSATNPFSHASSRGLLGWLSVFAFMAAQDVALRCVTSKFATLILLQKNMFDLEHCPFVRQIRWHPNQFQTYATLQPYDSHGMACTPHHKGQDGGRRSGGAFARRGASVGQIPRCRARRSATACRPNGMRSPPSPELRN